MKIHELFTKPHSWCKMSHARNVDDIDVESNSPDACKWCLLGAVERCYPYKEGCNVRERLIKALNVESTRMVIKISDWNDDLGRTHVEVLELVTRLDV